MKILTVSDKVVNGLLEQPTSLLPQQPDLILACGDLPPEYLTELRERFGVPLYFVEGNHDIRYQSSPPVGCIDLHAKIMEEQGIRIMGFGGSRWYNGGINQYTENEMKKTVRSLWFQLLQQRKVDIIMTHAPPRFIHDKEDPCHKGFKTFTGLIEKKSPAYFIHGHIHAFFNNPTDRITMVHETKVINSYGFFFFETEVAPR
ncbi:MAG: metallophosphoesterase [Proteobacteria bacterium]|nr:metallophosphoesterase [Pseudomonadota bacterium]MBU1234193.1 metallophosphoesterase [Pseudomonadota bacterium]MBU1419057.1 metallophosphoesterase [Pseudomonadota bacterium]MBU1454542.1 metallophosphoesterase [Pseudomonadota bacterium]